MSRDKDPTVILKRRVRRGAEGRGEEEYPERLLTDQQ